MGGGFKWFALLWRRLITCQVDRLCYNSTMRFGRFEFSLRRTPKPLPDEIVTALSRIETFAQDVCDRLEKSEANVKETRQRLETVYRKVYRDIAKADGEDTEHQAPGYQQPAALRPIRPGDTPEGV